MPTRGQTAAYCCECPLKSQAESLDIQVDRHSQKTAFEWGIAECIEHDACGPLIKPHYS